MFKAIAISTVAFALQMEPQRQPGVAEPAADDVKAVCPPSAGVVLVNETAEVWTARETYVQDDVITVVLRPIPPGTQILYQADSCGDDDNCRSPMPDALDLCVNGNCSNVYDCTEKTIAPIIEHDENGIIIHDSTRTKLNRIADAALEAARDAGLDVVVTIEEVD